MDDREYYKTYYERLGNNAYLGQSAKDWSRMRTFKDWLTKHVKPGASILDIGCGDGAFARMMPDYNWVNMDINTERAADAPGQCLTADIQDEVYNLPDKSFDAIVCSEVLEHLFDPRIVHRNAKRLLKRDGIYIVSTPNFNWVANFLEGFQRLTANYDHPWTIEHIRHYTLDSHTKILREFGFHIEENTGADAHYCPVYAAPALQIQENLKKLYKVDVPIGQIHQWIGQGTPTLQHTVIMRCKKV